jgi:hypothetical protein
MEARHMMAGRHIRTYAQLMAAVRERAVELNTTREQIDHVAGLTPGYAGKILSRTLIKRMHWKTFDLVLPALGMMLIAVEDPEATAKLRGRYCRRGTEQIGRRRVR